MIPELLGKFEAVFDRGAFEAIGEVDREAYADLILQCLAPKFRYLLNGYEYEAGDYQGTPRCVPRVQVFKLFQRNNPEIGEHDYFLSQTILRFSKS
jgi:thiopurine S-methyltransferase